MGVLGHNRALGVPGGWVNLLRRILGAFPFDFRGV